MRERCCLQLNDSINPVNNSTMAFCHCRVSVVKRSNLLLMFVFFLATN